MLSRRSVRVKIMQLLYAKDRDGLLTAKDLVKQYDESIDVSFELFLFVIFLFTKITEQAQPDAKKRLTKHLPSDFDKAFSSKLHDNSIVTAILNDNKLQARFQKLGYEKLDLGDFYSKMYKDFAKTEAYEQYILSAETHERDLDILLELFRYLRGSEYFNEVCDDNYIHWFDEKSLVVGALKKYLKAQPEDPGYYNTYYPDNETVKEYGHVLIHNVLEHDEELEAQIFPMLKNWDSERVAVIDMILMKMALCEMLYFTSIPGNVTINEYVEVAKNYSTDKSKEFVNGVLDTLYKANEAKK